MAILSFEETFGASGKIERTMQYLEKKYPQLNLPAYNIMANGDAAFSIDLNGDDKQNIKTYSTPFRIPRLDVLISSFVLHGTDSKKVCVTLWYRPRKRKVVK